MAKIVQIPTNPFKTDTKSLEEIRSILKRGKVIGFPTDTFYGLGADPFNVKAIKTIFTIKNRPANKPILILVSSQEQVETIVEDIHSEAQSLIDAFWPGPLTLVFKAKSHLPEILTAGTGTIGIRIPDFPLTRHLIESIDHPLTAPSANLSGQENPTTAGEVERMLGNRVPLIVDGGPTPGKLPSTVLAIHQSPPKLLRSGRIHRTHIEAILKTGISPLS